MSSYYNFYYYYFIIDRRCYSTLEYAIYTHCDYCTFFFFREAARECRRKKKEYIKCLENRVSVLENQNKALIEELKTLKELYCQTKTE